MAAMRRRLSRRVKRWLKRAWRGRRRVPFPLAAYALLAVATFLLANACYQVARKPTELLGVVPTTRKAPAETWESYGALCRAHATGVVSAGLLAALVQVESAGDPLARTYWRWRWRSNPLEVYAPASSAVGILQITDGTYEQARRLCIHDHAVAREGAWLEPRACWFNALYVRTVPSHAIEMTAAWLHQNVEAIVLERGADGASLRDRRRLAALVHLCGAGRGAVFAARGFRTAPGERCGDHLVAPYLARVEVLAAAFARMDAER
jgi:hypothetical protein